MSMSGGKEIIRFAALSMCLVAPGWGQTPSDSNGADLDVILPKLVIFDVPAAGANMLQSTMPVRLNAAGEIAGTYADAANMNHGFLRARDGDIVSFDPPGAVGIGTTVTDINAEGVIVGHYNVLSTPALGFLRAPDGTFTTFQVPGALYTYPQSINARGELVGFYANISNANHGFLRAGDGTITTFDAPGASDAPGLGTSPTFINAEGAIVGYAAHDTTDFITVTVAFERAPGGTFTEFQVGGLSSTFAQSINAGGAIVGYALETGTVVEHGFLRAPDGTITLIDAGHAASTFPNIVNAEGAMAGFANFQVGNNFQSRALGRWPDGDTITFNIPGASSTVANGLNSEGHMVGYFADTRGVYHGFLLIP
jgi:hypothetical protein